MRDGDYVKALAASLGTNAPTLLGVRGKRLLYEAGLLADSNTVAGEPYKPAKGRVLRSRRAAMKVERWQEWHQLLLDRPHLHGIVGGTRLVEKYELMLVPATEDRSGRSAL